jgi:hypothetical protein
MRVIIPGQQRVRVVLGGLTGVTIITSGYTGSTTSQSSTRGVDWSDYNHLARKLDYTVKDINLISVWIYLD